MCTDTYHLEGLKGKPQWKLSPIAKNFTIIHHPTRFREWYDLDEEEKLEDWGYFKGI